MLNDGHSKKPTALNANNSKWVLSFSLHIESQHRWLPGDHTLRVMCHFFVFVFVFVFGDHTLRVMCDGDGDGCRRSHFTGHVSLLYFANTKWLPQGKVASIVSHQERFYIKDAYRRLAVPAFRPFRRHIVHHTCHRVMSCMPSSKWQ